MINTIRFSIFALLLTAVFSNQDIQATTNFSNVVRTNTNSLDTVNFANVDFARKDEADNTQTGKDLVQAGLSAAATQQLDAIVVLIKDNVPQDKQETALQYATEALGEHVQTGNIKQFITALLQLIGISPSSPYGVRVQVVIMHKLVPKIMQLLPVETVQQLISDWLARGSGDLFDLYPEEKTTSLGSGSTSTTTTYRKPNKLQGMLQTLLQEKEPELKTLLREAAKDLLLQEDSFVTIFDMVKQAVLAEQQEDHDEADTDATQAE